MLVLDCLDLTRTQTGIWPPLKHTITNDDKGGNQLP